MARRTYRWLLLSLALVGVAADLGSKYAVFGWLYNFGDGDCREVVPGWFQLIAQFDRETRPRDDLLHAPQVWSGPVLPRVNQGALFGLGGSRKGLANGFFTGVSVLAAASIAVWGAGRAAAHDKWLSAALGLILGGTLGNLYDRIVFNGVRDFLHFYYVEWPVFNVADCCLVVGAAMLLVSAVFSPASKDEGPHPPKAPPTAAPAT